MQQNPAIAMTKHLMWTRDGVVWATWRLAPRPYGYASPETRKMTRLQHQSLLQALRGEALLLGLCAHTEPVAVAQKLLAGVDLRQCPEWAEEVNLTLDALTEVPVGERSFWLAVPLTGANLRHRVRSTALAVEHVVRAQLALPLRTPSEREVAEALEIAQRVEDVIPKAFQPQRVTPAEYVWMSAHAQSRGLGVDRATPLPEASDDALELSRFHSASELPNPLVDESGKTDLSPRDAKHLTPFRRRYVKVQSELAEEPSYQTLLALTAPPKDGWSEDNAWLEAVDGFAVPVDWAIRLQVSSAAAVRRRNKSAENTLRDQILQQNVDGETSIVDTGGNLSEVAEALQAYSASLNHSTKEVEVLASVIFAVGGHTPKIAEAHAQRIMSTFGQGEFVFTPMFGAQESLWWAMQPGISTEKVVREVAQLTTGREFATTVPIASNDVGDVDGYQHATNISNGRGTPSFLNLPAAVQADKAASVGACAELGAGKSYLMKLITGNELDRGGRAFMIDRTEAREYAKFALSLQPDNTAIVDCMAPEVSIDPLRLFGPKVGARYVQSLFSTLLGVKPISELGVELSTLMQPDNVAQNGITSLGAMRRYLAGSHEGPLRKHLKGLIDMVAEQPYGRVLFDESLPPLDINRRAIVALTAGLPLPTRDELNQSHLFDGLPLEKIAGRALYAFLTGLARQICFTAEEFSLAVFDECHSITSSPEGEAWIKDFLRDGRKHNTGVLLGSHDPADFGDPVMQGLIPYRFVMRHTDPALANRALTWLDKSFEGNQELIKELVENTSPAGDDGLVPPERRGETLFRDRRVRIAKVAIIPPRRPHRAEAIASTPKTSSEVDAA